MKLQRPLIAMVYIALVTLSSSSVGQEDTLGRLFTTPKERARLNLIRQTYSITDTQPPVELRQNDAAQVDSVTLNGYVTRNNGKITTWVNRVEDQTNSLQSVQNRHQAPHLSLKTEAGNPVNLSVGDTVNLRTGALRKVYQPYTEQAVAKDTAVGTIVMTKR